MRSLVRLEVRTLGVDLFASEKLALVYPPFGVGRVVDARMLGADRRRRRHRRRRRRPRYHRYIPGESPYPNYSVPRHPAHPQHIVQITPARTPVTVALARFRTRGRREGRRNRPVDQSELEGVGGVHRHPVVVVVVVLVIVVHRLLKPTKQMSDLRPYLIHCIYWTPLVPTFSYPSDSLQ